MSSELTRRDALRRLAVGSAAAVTAPLWVQSLASAAGQHAAHRTTAQAAAAWTPKVFTPAQNAAVVALTETIIPRTGTAGAAEAKVNEFIDDVLSGAAAGDRQRFLDGLAWIDERSRRDTGRPYAEAAPEQQIAILTPLSAATAQSTADQPGVDFFKALKSMTVAGYYSSEIATREELEDDGTMFFAEFKGCTHPEHGA